MIRAEDATPYLIVILLIGAGIALFYTGIIDRGLAVSIPYNCTDTDGGHNLSVRGDAFVTKPDGTEWGRLPDRCFTIADGNYSDSGDRLQEMYCKKAQNANRNGMLAFKTYTCTCADGACIA